MKAGHEIIAFDMKEPADKGVRFVKGDILDLAGLQGAMKGVEAVIHLAAIRHPMSDPPEKVFNVNAMGTFNVLEAAARCGVRRVAFAGSDSTLGFLFRRNPPLMPEYLPIDEDHPLKTEDPYGLSKLVGEEICRMFARRYDMETICLRVCRVWFPHLPQHYRSLRDPKNWWQGLWAYQDARDAAQAFRLATEAPARGHQSLFICADDNGTPLNSMELIRKYYPGVQRVDEARLSGRASLISADKAKKALGYRPRYTWEDTLTSPH
jgi:nucleoside-diphosphate-sugar epimerase